MDEMFKVEVDLVELVALQNAIGMYADSMKRRAEAWHEKGNQEKERSHMHTYDMLVRLAHKAALAERI